MSGRKAQNSPRISYTLHRSHHHVNKPGQVIYEIRLVHCLHLFRVQSKSALTTLVEPKSDPGSTDGPGGTVRYLMYSLELTLL